MFDEKNVPYWLEMLWEDACTRTKKILTKYSADYKRMKEQKEEITKEYPELVKIIEGDEIGYDIVLDADKRKKLVELIGICTDVLWLYEKTFYLLGMAMGINLSEILQQVNHDIK